MSLINTLKSEGEKNRGQSGKKEFQAQDVIAIWASKKEMGGEEGGGGGTADSTTTATTGWVEELQRSLQDSKESAIQSARSLHHNSSTHLRSLQVSYAFFLVILLVYMKLKRKKKGKILCIKYQIMNVWVLQDFVPHAFSRYKSYEDAFVNKLKGFFHKYLYLIDGYGITN